MARKNEIVEALQTVCDHGNTVMRQQSATWMDVSTIDETGRYLKCAVVSGDLLNLSTWDRQTGRETNATCHRLTPSQRTFVREWIDTNFWPEI